MLKIAFYILFFTSVAITKMKAVIPDVKTALLHLNTKKSFIDFNLGLTKAEKQQLEKIVVRPCDCYDNYGDLSKLVVDLTIYFESLGNDYDSSHKVAISIHKIVERIVKDLEIESFWLTMRLPNKSDMYNIPRWHTDGYYYPPYKGRVPKVVFTLKGPTTLFYSASSDDRKVYDEIFYRRVEDQNDYYYGNTIEGRNDLVKIINNSNVHQPLLQTGTVYIVGDKTSAAIHSEPTIHEDRIFISIVPGSKKQIQELRSRHQNKEYIKPLSKE
ncbi:MAG: hypothetical protein ACK4V2_04255 [Pseudomonadota bacterium]|jgi:hypothetical protein|nr:hypothetical protein [Alphaproteobacteria bacterium]